MIEEGKEQREEGGSFSMYYYLGYSATQVLFHTSAPLCKDRKKDHRMRILDFDSVLVSVAAFLCVHVSQHAHRRMSVLSAESSEVPWSILTEL